MASGTNILQNNQTAGLAALNNNQTAGTAALQAGQTGALGALDASRADYAPLAQKYGAATTLGLDSLGANGAAGNARAVQAFQAGPGYQFGVDQSLDSLARHSAAVGGNIGGNTLAALSDRAGQMANQEYGSWQDRLNGYVSPELQATAGMANADANKAGVYTGTGNSLASLGTNTTNGIVGLGTATAGGLTNLGTGTAQGIVGLGTNTTNGIANQNTQSANAEMQGNANMWNFGLNAAKAVASGGTSLLGGLGGGGGGIVLGGAGGPGQFG